MVLQFIGAADIKLVSRGAFKLLAAPLDVQRIAGGGVGGQKFLGPFPRDDNLAGLGDDDRPTEERQNQQREHRGLALGSRLLDGELQGVGGQEGNGVKWEHDFWRLMGGMTPRIQRP